MGTSRRFSHSLPALGFALALYCDGARLTLADPPTGTPVAGDAPVPQSSFLSSLTQAFKQDFDHQVVRGHFDVGSPPDAVHRYYCLVDAKTGKRQANGVAGQPFQRPDGMTGIKGTAVSLYGCASSEQQGILVTAGYVLIGGAASQAAVAAPPAPMTPAVASAASPAAPAPVTTSPVTASPVTTPAVSGAVQPPFRIDVAGVTLGMSVDEVRTVLKSKQLLDYQESTQTLGHLDPANGAAAAATGAHFVNVIAAWTPSVDGDGEAYAVMFTPVPGRERAMAIIHSVASSPSHAVGLDALTRGLVKKYGGYAGSDELPAAPTWRIQSNAAVQVGDACKRRGLYGGLADLSAGTSNRPNLALKTTPDEFRYQIDVCGVALVTEDHVMAGDTAPHAERAVKRFTVTAYSPAIAFDGATAAAQLMQANAGADATTQHGAVHAGDAAAPNL